MVEKWSSALDGMIGIEMLNPIRREDFAERREEDINRWARALAELRTEMRVMLEEDSHAYKMRYLLKQRISRMIDRLIEADIASEPRDVHALFLKEGGKSQTYMTAEELRAKVDWLYDTWPDVFKRDTRDWVPASKSMAPALSRHDRKLEDN